MSSLLVICLIIAYAVFAFFSYIRAKSTKAKIISSAMMGVIVAVAAYNFIPSRSFDLTRHHAISSRLAKVESVEEFAKASSKSDLEIVPQVYSMIIGKIGDHNLLQAIAVLIGYSLLFYILIDYKSSNKTSAWKFMPILLLAVFGQNILYFFSGLYCYLAINIMAFAFYIDYYKGKKKTAIVLYCLSPLVHVSSLVPIIIIFLSKIKKDKVNWKVVAALAILMVFFGTASDMVVKIVQSNYLEGIKSTYDSYVRQNLRFAKYYDGMYMYMTVTKIAIALIACWCQRKNEASHKIRNIVMMLSLATIILSFATLAITRLSSLVLYFSVPIIFDSVSDRRTLSKILLIAIGVISISYAFYSVFIIMPYMSIG